MLKKSYMNKSNLINENFFTKLKRLLGLSTKEEKILKKNKKFMKSFKDLNSNVVKLEKMMNDEMKDFGSNKKIKLNQFKLSDFI